jgi:hypothetical protein
MLQLVITFSGLIHILPFPPAVLLALVVTRLNPVAHFMQSLSPESPVAVGAAVNPY